MQIRATFPPCEHSSEPKGLVTVWRVGLSPTRLLASVWMSGRSRWSLSVKLTSSLNNETALWCVWRSLSCCWMFVTGSVNVEVWNDVVGIVVSRLLSSAWMTDESDPRTSFHRLCRMAIAAAVFFFFAFSITVSSDCLHRDDVVMFFSEFAEAGVWCYHVVPNDDSENKRRGHGRPACCS